MKKKKKKKVKVSEVHRVWNDGKRKASERITEWKFK